MSQPLSFYATTENISQDPDSQNLGTAELTWLNLPKPVRLVQVTFGLDFPAENTQPLQYSKNYPIMYSVGDGINYDFAQGLTNCWSYLGGFGVINVDVDVPQNVRQIRVFLWTRFYKAGSAQVMVVPE